MNNVQAGGTNPAAFRTLIVCGLGSLILGLATPLLKDSKSFFSQADSKAVGLLAVLAIPILVGAFASPRSPGFIGFAAGAALFTGVGLGLIWSFSVAVLVNESSDISPGPGLFFLIASSVLLIVATLTSIRFRVADSVAAASPIAVLGVIATVTTVVGALIPTHGVKFKYWMGFGESGWIGMISVALLAAYLFIGIAGFRGGRWGLGLVAGFVGEILLGNLTAGNGNNLISAVSESGTNWHPLARVGFFATAGLLVLHLIQTLSTTSAGTAGQTAYFHPPSVGFQQSPGNQLPQSAAPGHQQNPAPPVDSPGWWNQGTNPFAAAVAPTPAKPTHPSSPARWVSDPFGRHQFRYWNGRTWTDMVADNGVAATDPPVESPPSSGFVPPTTGPWGGS